MYNKKAHVVQQWKSCRHLQTTGNGSVEVLGPQWWAAGGRHFFFPAMCVCVCVSVGEIDSGCQSLKCECVCWWAYKWCAVQGRYHTSGTQSQ